MGKASVSCAERNRQLSMRDGAPGRHGRLRVWRDAAEHCNAKHPLQFECLDCGTGSQGGWTMLIHNVLLGSGCPVCRIAAPLQAAFQARFPQHRLVPLTPRSGPPAPASMRYDVRPLVWRVPDDFGWAPPSLAHVSIKRAIAEGRLPGDEMLNKAERFADVIEQFSGAFPAGRIRYAGASKPGMTSPGPFYSIDTGARALRRPIASDAITAEGLLKHCRQEAKDRKLKLLLEGEAAKHKATILGYEYPESGGFQVRYLSRTGFTGCDTIWRAREKFWGQSGFRRGETLALVVLAELFPATDWLRNTRPAFLLKDNGYRLELDGYSASQRLALEYQGSHHDRPRSASQEDRDKYRQVRLHDRLKARLCVKAGVRLVVVPEAKLDPAGFLASITAAVVALGIAPANPFPSLDAIRQRWNDICANPLAPFQALLLERLGVHRLLDPDLSCVVKTTVIRYECGNCKEENEALANGFTSGAPRRYCPQCTGEELAARKRSATLDLWESAGLPRSFLDCLEQNQDDGRATYVHRCDRMHRTPIHGVEHAMRHLVAGIFHCPTCVAEHTGIAASHVANLSRYRQNLARDLATVGLTVVRELPYDEEGELAAEVECRQGHRFTTNRRKVNLILRNECLNDPDIVPSACPQCCYPHVGDGDFWLLRSTVFHRLYVLKGMYPRARYLSDFDAASWQEESYDCGEVHADGTPHPPIRISFRNLQKSARRNPASHLCAACGLEAGQVVGGSKTLEDLAALVHVMRDDIARRMQLPGQLSPPMVEYLSGEISADGTVSTTGTRLRWRCGVSGHPPVDATKNDYFHRSPARGQGFCPCCVDLLGEKKAPLPAGQPKGGALRVYALRKPSKGTGR